MTETDAKVDLLDEEFGRASRLAGYHRWVATCRRVEGATELARVSARRARYYAALAAALGERLDALLRE
jgi:hypothetical protein